MKRIFSAEALAPRHPEPMRRVSPTSRELAHYLADMLHSMKTCAHAPDLRALQTLIDAAEREARLVLRDNPPTN